MTRIIDIYTHIMPAAFTAAFGRASPKLGNIAARLRSVAALHDLDLRFRQMDAAGEGYEQVISLPNPPLEDVTDAATAAALSRIANDGLAELCARHPDRFPAFVATIPMGEPDAAVAEAERAIGGLGARGVQVFTNVAGKPLDLPEYEPVFATLAHYDLPIWLHPARTAEMTDYASEPRSRFEMWWCFGWPYETSVAVSRLVFSGLFDRHQGLKLVTHHGGGMIPYYDGRIGLGMEVLGSRTTDEDLTGVLPALERPHLDYFRDIFADTAMFGSGTGLPTVLAFYGARRMVFATDAPLGPIPPTLRVLDALDLTPEDRQAILSGNAERLLRLHGAADQGSA